MEMNGTSACENVIDRVKRGEKTGKKTAEPRRVFFGWYEGPCYNGV